MNNQSTTTDMQVCVNCRRQSKSTELYCVYCGYILPHVLNEAQYTVSYSEADQHNADLQWGTGYFHYRAKLYLHLEESTANHNLDIIEVPLHRSPAILGRGSAEDTDELRVDLTPFGALQQGVSRRHLRIDLRGDVLQITDLESYNGTYLNRGRLVPNKPYTLRNRAVLQLGHMLLRVQFA